MENHGEDTSSKERQLKTRRDELNKKESEKDSSIRWDISNGDIKSHRTNNSGRMGGLTTEQTMSPMKRPVESPQEGPAVSSQEGPAVDPLEGWTISHKEDENELNNSDFFEGLNKKFILDKKNFY